MAITLRTNELAQTLERAYLLAIGGQDLPAVWITRAEQLGQSPSVAFIAAVGSVLLAKATDDAIDAFVLQAQEGSAAHSISERLPRRLGASGARLATTSALAAIATRSTTARWWGRRGGISRLIGSALTTSRSSS